MITKHDIWKCMKDGDLECKTITDNVPDEFYDDVKAVRDGISRKVAHIIEASRFEYAQSMTLERGKERAEYFGTCAHPPVLFGWDSDRDHEVWNYIWKAVKPEAGTVFDAGKVDEV